MLEKNVYSVLLHRMFHIKKKKNVPYQFFLFTSVIQVQCFLLIFCLVIYLLLKMGNCLLPLFDCYILLPLLN